MSQSRLEMKVGLFVLFCLGLFGLLLLQFSKGATLFRPTKEIILNAANVGGLRVNAAVLESGVKVGTVSRTVLAPEGTNVAIYLRIFNQFVVYDDSVFRIEQSGFLGDQYVAIYPGTNIDHHPFKNGAQARANAPFNLEEVASSANDLIAQFKGTLHEVQRDIEDIRTKALNDNTLSNFADTVSTLREASTNALTAVSNINVLITTNGPLGDAIVNLKDFSDKLNAVALQAQGILATNEPQINRAVSNIQTSTAVITNLLAQVQSGKGLAGALVQNQAMANDIATVSSNLAVTTGNLNRLGFWHWLWYKPKPDTNAMWRIPVASAPNP